MNDNIQVWIRKRKLKKKCRCRGPCRCKEKHTYHLRWLDLATGGWRSKKVGTDRKVAEREAAVLEKQIQDGTFREQRRVTWGAFVAEHVANLDRTSATVSDVKRTLEAFGEICKPAGPHAVTYRMIEHYVDHLKGRGNSVATRNKRLRYLRAAFNRAIKRGYLSKNPMSGWEWAKVDLKAPRVLTADEKTKLLDACPTDQWRAFVFVALTTGCRRGELLGLTWNRVDLETGGIVVTGTKAHRDRTQPLNEQAIRMLRGLQASTLKDGGPFQSLKSVNAANRFRIIVERSGIAYCSIHDLRKTFCTDLARLGVNQLVVQRLAGHACSATTATYYQHVNDQMKREAVAKLATG